MEELTPEQKAKRDEFTKSLEEIHTVQFSKGQLILIFNLITQITLKYGDFVQFKPIIDTLQPLVLVESAPAPQPPAPPVDVAPATEPVITN
jgi:hypothetical protein